MKKFKIAMIVILLISFVFAGVSLAFLSDTIPTHFGIDGNPDQFGSKYFVIAFPLVGLIVAVTMLLVCKYAKVSENYQKYTLLVGVCLQALFFIMSVVFVIYGLIYTEDSQTLEVSKIMMPLMGVLFIILGNFMPKVEKNSTLGTKTKWALYNEVTWQKTQRFTGFVSVVVGFIVIVVSFFFKDMVNFIILMVLIFAFAVASTAASYKYYQEEKAKESAER